jgi:hypothetical protein
VLGVEVALDGPVLDDAQRGPRACLPSGCGGWRAARGARAAGSRGRRAAGQVPDASPQAARISDTRATCSASRGEAHAIARWRSSRSGARARRRARPAAPATAWPPSAGRPRRRRRRPAATRSGARSRRDRRVRRRPAGPSDDRERSGPDPKTARRCRRCSRRRPAGLTGARRPRRCAPRRRW